MILRCALCHNLYAFPANEGGCKKSIHRAKFVCCSGSLCGVYCCHREQHDEGCEKIFLKQGGFFMYYSSGNYEAFAHPKKPEGVDHKSAYIIGSGLAALTAACYLVRDGQMKGEHVHVFEKNALAGGACDGYKYDIGYVMRGGREMDNHFEVNYYKCG